MALSNIIFRALVKAGYTTKGAELTWLELDNNQEELLDAILGFISGALGNIAPYDNGTVYSMSPPTYVSRLGNIYLYINATPSAGNAPESSPLYWQLSSAGELFHVQGTDVTVGAGTVYQTSHIELYDIVNSQVINVADSTAFLALVTAATLKKNRIYYLVAEKIAIRSTSTSTYSNKGYFHASIPKLSTALYDSVATYAIGDKVQYNGLVWNNFTGVNDAVIPPSDATNWVQVAQYGSDYDNRYFDCDIANVSGTFAADNITDHFGNNVYLNSGVAFMIGRITQSGNRFIGVGNAIQAFNAPIAMIGNVLQNDSDITITAGSDGECNNNQLNQSEVNASITGSGKFNNNKLTRVQISAPSLTVEVSGLEIELNEIGLVQLNPGHLLTSGYLKPTGGNIVLACDADNTSTGTTLELINSTMAYNSVYGVYEIEDGNTVAWTKLSAGLPFDIPYKIIAKKGTTLELVSVLWAAKTMDCILGDGSTYTLLGDAEDYVIVRKINVSGTNYYQIIDSQIQD